MNIVEVIKRKIIKILKAIFSKPQVNSQPININEKENKTMREGIQTNFPNEALRRFGCYFFILMKWLEVKNGMSFTDEMLLEIFERAVAAGIMNGDNAFINRPVDLMNMALGQNSYRDIRRDLSDAPADGTAIRRLVRGTAGETHFTLQISGKEWDTLDPARPAAATWSFHSFRVPV